MCLVGWKGEVSEVHVGSIIVYDTNTICVLTLFSVLQYAFLSKYAYVQRVDQ